MSEAVKRARRKRKTAPMLADRLLALFGFELGVLEQSVEPLRAGAAESGRDLAAGAKGRIEALGQMVRTLEKLLELRQFETLASGAAQEGPDAEAERLAAELMRRLRVLDRRRRATGQPASGADEAGSIAPASDGEGGVARGLGGEALVSPERVSPIPVPPERVARACAALPI